MNHPDRTFNRQLIKNRRVGVHEPLYCYRDLAEILGVHRGTITVAVNKHKEIFYPPDAIVTRPPHKAKPMWEKERFLKMWKLYKELHP